MNTTPTTSVKDIKKLHEGDQVILYPRSYVLPPKVVKIEKVTPHRIQVAGIYFDRKKGYACGHGQDPFPPALQVPSGPAELKQYIDKPLKSHAKKRSNGHPEGGSTPET